MFRSVKAEGRTILIQEKASKESEFRHALEPDGREAEQEEEAPDRQTEDNAGLHRLLQRRFHEGNTF